MIKFIVPTIILILLVIFWEKFNDMIYQKFSIRLNYLLVTVIFLIIIIIFFLIKN